ncbi:MAG TPA: hypothetical protein PKA82_16380 [Pyrinomonadaceae bacterium]|nr:hypothetical protein [Pyrinomonadaceae bacterium]
MKNSLNLCLGILLLVVVGCSCPNLKELTNKGSASPTPTSSPGSPSSTPTITTKKGEYDVTMAKYEKIKIGTSRDEVESILGGKGEEVSNTTGGGVRFSVNKWEGDNYASIILSFKNDKVMTRSQVGLK